MRTVADFPFFTWGQSAADAPLALAHRGGTKYPPNIGIENSLKAFRNATDLGYRILETDVQVSADGAVVAFHDPRLDRATDATGAIADLPYAVIAEASIGGTEPIPTLHELLEEFPETALNIDIKADRALEPTLEVLRAHNALNRVCLASFSDKRIRAARRLVTAMGGAAQPVATSAGRGGVILSKLAPGFLSRLVHTSAPALQVPARQHVRGRVVTIATPGLVEVAHRLGKHVHVWFHAWDDESPAELHRLLDIGVDGIISDRIDVLADVLAARGYPL